MKGILKGIVGMFSALLAILTAISSAHLPVNPESLARVYAKDLPEATALTSAFAFLGLAVCVVLVAIRLFALRTCSKASAIGSWLCVCSCVMLLTSAVASIANNSLASISATIATAIRLAEDRESIDPLARDELVAFQGEGRGVWERYKLATSFLEDERGVAQSQSDTIYTTFDAPLQKQVEWTYIGAICSLKWGLFLAASTLVSYSFKRSNEVKPEDSELAAESRESRGKDLIERLSP